MVWKPHTTVAAIIEQKQRFLLVEERVNGCVVFNQPAGHVDANERLIDAVIRETQEESAYTFKPTHIIGCYYWQKQDKSTTYMRVCYTGEITHHHPEQALDDGIIAAHWLTREEVTRCATKLRSPMVMRNIDDYLKGRRFPLDMITDLGDL